MRRLIAQAVEAEFETFLASNAELVLSDGRRRVVRHGHDPIRAIQTGIGPVDVQKPKARDRGATTGARIRFTSNILPKWARRTKSLDALVRMHPVPLRQVRNRRILTQRLKRDLRLERRIKLLA